MAFENSYNQEFNFVNKLYLKELFPHSWIFHGPKDSGKRKFLDIFIKKVLKEKTNGNSVYEINSDENPAMIDDVRKLINQCNLTNSVNNVSKTFLVINNLELLNNCQKKFGTNYVTNLYYHVNSNDIL